MNKPDYISVVIPTYKNPAYLDICLKSLYENQTRENQILVVIDGDDGEYNDMIKKYPKVNLLRLPVNQGQQIAHNLGVYNASSAAVLLLNDDNVVPRKWDEHLLDCWRDKTIIIPNQVEPRPSIFPMFIIKDFGITPETFRYDEFIEWEKTVSEDRITLEGSTWPILFNKKWFMAIGGFDTNYPSPAVCDWDLFLKFELIGVKCIRTHRTHFYHFSGAATKTPDRVVAHQQKEQKSFEYFAYKWKYNPTFGINNSFKPSTKRVNGVVFNE